MRFAFVQLQSDYPGTTLELSTFADGGVWKPVCVAPCERELMVQGAEARVSAPGMSTSNVFLIEPGRGRALVKVDGGSSTAQRWGLTGLIAGIPTTMLGMAGFGYGALADEEALQIAGGITLGVGAAMLLTALPLLIAGGTDVRDGKGRQIAERDAEPTAF